MQTKVLLASCTKQWT